MSERSVPTDAPPRSRCFRDLGDEHNSRAIAEAIVRTRKTGPLTTTAELALICHDVAAQSGGRRALARGIDPATRVFQALRMEVNGELSELSDALDVSNRRSPSSVLSTGALACVISFHGKEHALVRKRLRPASGWQPFLPRVIRPTPEEVCGGLC